MAADLDSGVLFDSMRKTEPRSIISQQSKKFNQLELVTTPTADPA